MFAFYSAPNSSVLFAGNTTIGYSTIMFDLSCQSPNGCGSTPYVFRDNIMLGFLQPTYNPQFAQPPAVYYLSDDSDNVIEDHNVYYNTHNIDCPSQGDICSDPLFVNEPPLTVVSESQFDNFNFSLSSNSPAIGAGVAISGLTTDLDGNPRANPPSDGAIESQ